jgi:hypothetical protein
MQRTDEQLFGLLSRQIAIAHSVPYKEIDKRSIISTRKAIEIGNYLNSKYGYEITTKKIDELVEQRKIYLSFY